MNKIEINYWLRLFVSILLFGNFQVLKMRQMRQLAILTIE